MTAQNQFHRFGISWQRFPGWPLILIWRKSFGLHVMRIGWAMAYPLWGIHPT
jgi:hypothetical protein